jgi:membrane-associated phospholipid phosphatase
MRALTAAAPAHRRPPAAWIRIALGQIRAHAVNPIRAARALALVSVAMNDAIQTLHASLSDVRPSRTADEAVASDAASMVLAQLFPDRRTQLRAGVASTTVGAAVAQRVVARARHDGSAVQWTAVRPTGAGLWQPTPPAFAPPLDPLAGTWRTWNLNRGAQFRPPPPPAPGSALFDAEAQQVYDTSRALTEEQRHIAMVWADGIGTTTPPGHWNAIALALMRPRRLDPARAAFLLATLNTAQADAFIACWDAKYAYWSVRPVTVIQQWWYDPGWTPLLATPPFPSYPSGHATTSAAAAAVLGWFFPSARRHLLAMADQAAISRLYAGIHFASDTRAGLALGRRVAEVALRRVAQSTQQRR